MRIDERVRSRMQELIQRGEYISRAKPQWRDDHGRELLYESEGWVASATNLLQVVFPDPLSAHRARAALPHGFNSVGALTAILKVALVDIDAGVIATVADAARGEVFDDFLEHADQFLRAGRIDRAGVVAGVVFEDTMRRACTKHNILEKGVDLEQLIIALNKRGLLTDLKAKRARHGAGVRAKATHAQWDEVAASDVEDTMKFTRELIDTLLGA